MECHRDGNMQNIYQAKLAHQCHQNGENPFLASTTAYDQFKTCHQEVQMQEVLEKVYVNHLGLVELKM
jgi:hypothetical protein